MPRSQEFDLGIWQAPTLHKVVNEVLKTEEKSEAVLKWFGKPLHMDLIFFYSIFKFLKTK